MGHILDAGIVTGALGAWCRLGMKTCVTVGSNLEIKLDVEECCGIPRMCQNKLVGRSSTLTWWKISCSFFPRNVGKSILIGRLSRVFFGMDVQREEK